MSKIFFKDSLVPLVVSTSKHADCLQTKKNEWEKLESKLDTGNHKYLLIDNWKKIIKHLQILYQSPLVCRELLKFLGFFYNWKYRYIYIYIYISTNDNTVFKNYTDTLLKMINSFLKKQRKDKFMMINGKEKGKNVITYCLY